MKSLIDVMAKSLYDCIHNQVKSVKFMAINYREKNEDGSYKRYEKTIPASENDVELYAAFPQLWGSTALGFSGGIGGSAMTEAYTTIFRYDNSFYVYFGGNFAYAVDKPNETFYNDIQDRNMKPTGECKKYE